MDDFYDDPDLVRQQAHVMDLVEPGGGSGWFLSKQPGASAESVFSAVSSMLGAPLYDIGDFGPGSTNGRFAFGLETAASMIRIHSDPYEWAALVYLTPEPPPNSDTSFYRWRATNRTRRPKVDDNSDLKADTPLAPQADRRDFDVIENITNRYNRLIVYDPRLYHATQRFFGYDRRTARLTQNLFQFERFLQTQPEWAMARLGATLPEAQTVFETFSVSGSKTHPPRAAGLDSVARGGSKAGRAPASTETHAGGETDAGPESFGGVPPPSPPVGIQGLAEPVSTSRS